MMSSRQFGICFVIGIVLAGCRQSDDEGLRGVGEDPSPTLFGHVTISEIGQATIGLSESTVSFREIRDSTSAAGWLAASPASEVVVKAPAAGFVTWGQAPEITLGDFVEKNQNLAELKEFLSPQEQSQLVTAKEETDILIAQSLASLKLAEEHLRGLSDSASTAVPGSRLMELREIVARSNAAIREAREKLPYLPAEPYDDIQLKAVPLVAPLSGRLVNVHFVPRQLVLPGDPLWTIADWSRLWIRVPVFASDLARIDQSGAVNVTVLGGKSLKAKPVNIPQVTLPRKQTVELIYETENTTGELRPGQAVTVWLPSGQLSEKVVIPRTAVIWDGMGNSWVYGRTTDTTFRRRKVELGQALDGDYVVRHGLGESDSIVVVGAESLYSEEFKWQIQAEDDD